jgi:hypothetical protein
VFLAKEVPSRPNGGDYVGGEGFVGHRYALKYS